MSDPLRFPRSCLPDDTRTECDFEESSFFKQSPQIPLPTPSEVRAVSCVQHSREIDPQVVRFDHLSLIVKFGLDVTVTEAQNLWIIRQVLGDEVPVPEVYAWRVDGKEVFIYMELIHGETLKARWDTFTTADKAVVCDQLHQMLSSLRRLKQEPDDVFVGSINRKKLLDIVFEKYPEPGPFRSVKEFQDWFSKLPQCNLDESQKYEDPYRPYMPDDGPITFSHCDLHRANIIVSSTNPPKVLAIIDWAQSGWYPDYWDYCKACFTSSYSEEWQLEWIPRFLNPYPNEHIAFMEFTMAIGAI